MFSHSGTDRTNHKQLPWALLQIQGVKLSKEKEVQRETWLNAWNYQGYWSESIHQIGN